MKLNTVNAPLLDAGEIKIFEIGTVLTPKEEMHVAYGDKKEDFGNLGYSEFLEETKELMKKLFSVTKTGGYNIWVIKDYRDTRNKIPYISFHSDLAKIGEEIGFKFHDLIIWDQTGQRKLVLLGYPSIFYTNQNCSFLVVFRKPNGY